jgi:hypothetical protein
MKCRFIVRVNRVWVSKEALGWKCSKAVAGY